jgi:hypothetical protein
LWDMANGVQLLNAHQGVFAERVVTAPDSTTASHVVHWPGRQYALRGWYQKWSLPPTGLASDTVTISITDTKTKDTGILQWQVTDATGTTYLVGSGPTDIGDSAAGHGPYTVSTENGIILEVDLIGEVADWTATVTFDLTAAADSTLGTWTFATGVDPTVTDAFKLQRGTFLSFP